MLLNQPSPLSGDDAEATRSSLIRRLRNWEDHASWQEIS